MSDMAMPDGKPLPPPDERYQPATTDSRVMLRFIGNTAVVGMVSFLGRVDPFQLLAASEYLRYIATNMIRASEQAEAAMRIRPGTPEQVARAAQILRPGG